MNKAFQKLLLLITVISFFQDVPVLETTGLFILTGSSTRCFYPIRSCRITIIIPAADMINRMLF